MWVGNKEKTSPAKEMRNDPIIIFAIVFEIVVVWIGGLVWCALLLLISIAATERYSTRYIGTRVPEGGTR